MFYCKNPKAPICDEGKYCDNDGKCWLDNCNCDYQVFDKVVTETEKKKSKKLNVGKMLLTCLGVYL